MNLSFYITHTIQEVLESFSVEQAYGLSSQQVKERQEQYGKNSLKQRDVTWLAVFLRQMASPFFYLLAGAVILSLSLGELCNAAMIMLFISINIILGFYQEYHAEHTIQMLKNLVVPQASVRRNNQDIMIASTDLVPGDIIYLEPGDILPADVRFIQSDDLSLDESALTGESLPVHKDANKANSIGFCGTVVISGKATAVVVATGSSTSLGSIARMSMQTRRESLFSAQIKKFSKMILVIMVVTLGVIFALHVLIKGNSIPPSQLALFAIALAVSIIPEALPIVVSFCLARGANKLAKNHVVVRRLSAIEDLGSIEVLCTDKTGTITENILSVVDVLGERDTVLLTAVRGQTTQSIDPNKKAHSFDAAILHAAFSSLISMPITEKVRFLPFDPARKCTHALVKVDNQFELIVSGALEAILSRCSQQGVITHDAAKAWSTQQGLLGRRVIAIAQKNMNYELSAQSMISEQDQNLVGLIAFVDPIKSTVMQAVKKARQLGVTIKIITGDAPEVAGAVAQQVGLVKNPSDVLTGAMFDMLTPADQAKALVEHAVFARVNPTQKLNIVKKLQETKKVGFLGEGINDAPALKIAHVAVVVENGTDIAKDAADIILLRKSLRVLINGIEEGRTVMANTVKYIGVTLASNFSNFYTIALVSLMLDYLPMLPLQILLLNMLSDLPMIAIATDYVDHTELADPQTYQFNDIIAKSILFGLIGTLFDFLFFSLFSRQSPGLLQTTWFMYSLIAEIVFFFMLRTKKIIFRAHSPSLPIILFSVLSCLIAITISLTTQGRSMFGFVRISGYDYALLGFVVLMYMVIVECVKYFYYRLAAKH